MPTYTNLESTPVNDILRSAPEAIAVLNRFGVDTCCGGGLPLGEAARVAGAPLHELLLALAPVLAQTDAGSTIGE